MVGSKTINNVGFAILTNDGEVNFYNYYCHYYYYIITYIYIIF